MEGCSGMGCQHQKAKSRDFGHSVCQSTIANVSAPCHLPSYFPAHLFLSIQLVFSNFYLGIALGAVDFATKYTTSKTRAWPYGGDNKEKATDEFYILRHTAISTPIFMPQRLSLIALVPSHPIFMPNMAKIAQLSQPKKEGSSQRRLRV